MIIISIDLNQKYIKIVRAYINKKLLLSNIQTFKENIKIKKNENIFNLWIKILEKNNIIGDKIIINLNSTGIESFTTNILLKNTSNESINKYFQKKISVPNIDFINFSCYEKKITKKFFNIIKFNKIKKLYRINAMYNNEIFFYKKLLNKFNITQFFMSLKNLSLINIIGLIDNKIKKKLLLYNEYLYIINIEDLEINICICNQNQIFYNKSLLKPINFHKNELNIINEIYQSLLISKISDSFSFLLLGNINKCIRLKKILIKNFKKNIYLLDSLKIKIPININFSSFSCILGSIIELINERKKIPMIKIKKMNKIKDKKNINIFFLSFILFIFFIFIIFLNKNLFLKDYIYQLELINLLIFKYS